MRMPRLRGNRLSGRAAPYASGSGWTAMLEQNDREAGLAGIGGWGKQKLAAVEAALGDDNAGSLGLLAVEAERDGTIAIARQLAHRLPDVSPAAGEALQARGQSVHDMRIESDAEHLHEQPAADAVDEVTGPDVAASAEGERRGEFVRGGRQAHLVGEDVGRALGNDPKLRAAAGDTVRDLGDGAVPPGCDNHARAGESGGAGPRSRVTRALGLRHFDADAVLHQHVHDAPEQVGPAAAGDGVGDDEHGGGSPKIWEQKRLE